MQKSEFMFAELKSNMGVNNVNGNTAQIKPAGLMMKSLCQMQVMLRNKIKSAPVRRQWM